MFSVVIVSRLDVGRPEHAAVPAGLEGIDEGYYEAARLDGATPWQLFWHVTIPLLRPTILFVLITSLINALSSFVLMLVLTEGGPARSTTVTGLYLYDMAFTDLRWAARRPPPTSCSRSSSASAWSSCACCGAAAWRRIDGAADCRLTGTSRRAAGAQIRRWLGA